MPSDRPVSSTAAETLAPESRMTTALFGVGLNAVTVIVRRVQYGTIPSGATQDNPSVDLEITRRDSAKDDHLTERDAEAIVRNLRNALVWLRKEKKREL